jgi:cell wall-associated protease
MKKMLLIAFMFSQSIAVTFAQKAAPDNWFNLDLKKNKVPGVSTERAYNELLKNKPSQTVVVAVIDGGTEVDHEDLKGIIWINEKEIPGNKIDDDKNGYVDDINGWNFIGGDSADVKEDNLEIARVYKQLSDQYANVSPGTRSSAGYQEYIKVKADFEKRQKDAKTSMTNITAFLEAIDKIIKASGKEDPGVNELMMYQTTDAVDAVVLKILVQLAKKKVSIKEIREQVKSQADHFQKQVDFQLNPDFDGRKVVGDNYTDVTERIYGNNHYEGPEGSHGTHVAGIIAAMRGNGTGMDGVASNVRIMVVRVVPDGDERDKDVANGIRYAVDNGAKVINMSFGKGYSPYKGAVDEAIKYAVSKDVVIVHAAGNDAENTDTVPNFPKDTYLNSTVTASTWIEVGASNWKKGKEITANFSNYGKNNVDVFAPGVSIYSTTPDSKYASFDGTSMAAPVTAGVVALVRSYYPNLTANQVKEVILQSAVKVKGKVQLPGDAKKKIPMTELCQTGGIVNAYEAIKLAETMSAKAAGQ